MPVLERPGGIQIYWEESGDGPLVVVACHWSGIPAVFDSLSEDLKRDHRLVVYDARGTGRSTRRGPHDMATAASDLRALLRELGGQAVVVGLADACNRAIHVAAAEPGLVRAVVAQGTVPVARAALEGTDAMVASDAVVEAFLQMLEIDYRAAQHNLMATANPQMTEDDVKVRVGQQVDYCPMEVGVARIRAWADDDPLAAARDCGERLWITFAPGMVGPWFPPFDQLEAVVMAHLPGANLVKLDDGLVSRPDLTADLIRAL